MGLNRCWIIGLILGAAIVGCSEATPPAPVSNHEQADQQRPMEKIAAAHLPNAYRLHEKVISGGMPEGEEAFRELKKLGVKTIISVDGAKPDVAMAHKFGLRYVHLPHGYDGISKQRSTELAKAVRDLDGPIYVHCHHGKHRSPTAATVACVGAGYLTPDKALSILHTAGTSEHYRGLYESADHARRIDDQLLDALDIEFPEVADLPPLAESMVDIERTFDRLKLVAKAGWQSPREHPDLDPPHAALLLREHFTELSRTAEVKQQPVPFGELLSDTVSAAESLEAALRAEKPGDSTSSRPTAAGQAFERISRNCNACHEQFRDVPQTALRRSEQTERPPARHGTRSQRRNK